MFSAVKVSTELSPISSTNAFSDASIAPSKKKEPLKSPDTVCYLQYRTLPSFISFNT